MNSKLFVVILIVCAINNLSRAKPAKAKAKPNEDELLCWSLKKHMKHMCLQVTLLIVTFA